MAWKDAHVSETSLTEAIGLIRQALGVHSQKPEFIQTVHRRGYRFVAPIATEPVARPPQVERSRPSEPVARTSEPAALQATNSRPPRRAVVAAVVVVAAMLTIGGIWVGTHRPPLRSEDVVRVNVTFPVAQARIPSVNAHQILAISPDGQRFVYVGGEPEKARLYLREMNRLDAKPLEGTDGAHGPFFSPDGEWVAFFAQGTLKKLRVIGEQRAEPQSLCATDTGVGGAWVSNSEIVFVPNWRGPLMRVSATGGKPVPFTLAGGATYRWPDRLDDHTVLATRWRSSADDAAVVAVSLASGAERVIATPATFGRSAPGGYVVFLRDGDLYAVELDGSGDRAASSPVRVVASVMTGTTGAAQSAISRAWIASIHRGHSRALVSDACACRWPGSRQ